MTTPRSRYRGPVAWMAGHPVAANLLMLALLIGGFVSAFNIKQEVFPEFTLDVIGISVTYPGASPEETETGILLVTEDAVRGIEGGPRSALPQSVCHVHARALPQSVARTRMV